MGCRGKSVLEKLCHTRLVWSLVDEPRGESRGVGGDWPHLEVKSCWLADDLSFVHAGKRHQMHVMRHHGVEHS